MKDDSQASDIDAVFDQIKDAVIDMMTSLPVVDITHTSKYRYGKPEGMGLHVYARFQLDNGYPKFDFLLWKELILWIGDKCKFVEFICWSKEVEIIEEIQDKILLIDKWNIGEQVFTRGTLTERTYELLLEDYLQSGQSVKWFCLYLFDKEENVIFVFSDITICFWMKK